MSDEQTARVFLEAEGPDITIREERRSPFEVAREVPVGLVDAYRRAREHLDETREDLLRAAGFDSGTAWEQLMDEQAELLRRQGHDE